MLTLSLAGSEIVLPGSKLVGRDRLRSTTPRSPAFKASSAPCSRTLFAEIRADLGFCAIDLVALSAAPRGLFVLGQNNVKGESFKISSSDHFLSAESMTILSFGRSLHIQHPSHECTLARHRSGGTLALPASHTLVLSHSRDCSGAKATCPLSQVRGRAALSCIEAGNEGSFICLKDLLRNSC